MHSLLSLSPSKSALLLIDLQEEQRADPAIAAANLDTVIRDCAKLLAVAREKGRATGQRCSEPKVEKACATQERQRHRCTYLIGAAGFASGV